MLEPGGLITPVVNRVLEFLLGVTLNHAASVQGLSLILGYCMEY